MSMQHKLIGACDTALLAIVGVLQLGVLLTLAKAVGPTEAHSVQTAHVIVSSEVPYTGS